MTEPSRRTALRLGGATLLSAISVPFSGCLGGTSPLVGNSSAPDIELVRSYDYSHFDQGLALVRTADGGFAFVVDVSSVGTDETIESDGVRIVRTAPDGTERWSRSDDDFAVDSVATSDSEAFVVGSQSSAAERGVRLLRVDSAGRVVWSQTYDVLDGSDFAAVAPAADGGYVFGGSDAREGRLTKMSASGRAEWSRTYGPSELPEFGSAGLSAVVPSADGGYFLVGHASMSSESGYSWFRKTDAEGAVEWRARYRVEGKIASATDATATPDGGLVVVGSTAGMGGWFWESEPDWALKFDADGRRARRHTFGSAHPRIVVSDLDGGTVVASRLDGDLDLRRLDADGKTEWRSKYPDADVYMPNALRQTDDGYAVLGRRHVGSMGDYGLTDAVLVELR